MALPTRNRYCQLDVFEDSQIIPIFTHLLVDKIEQMHAILKTVISKNVIVIFEAQTGQSLHYSDIYWYKCVCLYVYWYLINFKYKN